MSGVPCLTVLWFVKYGATDDEFFLHRFRRRAAMVQFCEALARPEKWGVSYFTSGPINHKHL